MLRMTLMLMIFLATVPLAQAETRTWPGASPCDSSLQACIDASVAADVVDVASSDLIAATIHINKPLTLRAAQGYRPVVAAGFAIAGNVNAAGNWSWSVEGFTLQQGFISLQVAGGSQATVSIRDNRVLDTLSGVAQISIYKPSAGSTSIDYRIEGNELAYYWDTFDGALRAAIQVLDGGSGNSEGQIRENRVTATGNQSIGILVSTQDRAHRVAVTGNQVLGGRSGSIFLRQGSLVSVTGGSLTALVASNLIRSAEPGEQRADGIRIDAYDGTVAADVLHNSVVDAHSGVDIFAAGEATISGLVSGNLFAYLGTYGLQRPASGISDGPNLYFDTFESESSPGLNPDSLFVNPMLRSVPDDPHLQSGSPAIDRVPGSTLASALDDFQQPYTDADGLRRFKRASSAFKSEVLDFGALEAGDTTLLHRVLAEPPNTLSHVSHPALDGRANAFPQTTQLWNPDGGVGIYNNQQQSLFYSDTDADWVLRQEGLASVTPGTAFTIFAPGSGSGRYLHQNSVSNTAGSFTELSDPELVNREDAILLVTRNPGSDTVVDVTSPIAVNYFAGVWSVVRLDGAAMPASGGFHVYFQPPSVNAFRHRTGTGNTSAHISLFDHPLLNGHPCARPHLTQATDFVAGNNHHIGVYYIGGATQRWALFNQDFAPLPLGAQFHVVIDPQAVDCPIDLFADGFESP